MLPTLLIVATASLFLDPSLHVDALPYYRNPRIHTLGDSALHAAVARSATKIIDAVAYNGEDVRSSLLACIPKELSVLDMCCGTGTSTRIPGVGIDTSEHMIREARWRRGRHSQFHVANAEMFGAPDSFDVVTLCFCLHEMPRGARQRVLTNAHRVARKSVFILDISPSYTPSDHMLFGEPYLLEYQDHIMEDLNVHRPKVHTVINGRLLFAETRAKSEGTLVRRDEHTWSSSPPLN